MLRSLWFASFLLAVLAAPLRAEPLRVAPFEADVTPPIGTPLCDALVMPAKRIDDPLFARGVVLIGKDAPVVLCAVDWVGIGNTGHTAFRDALAAAAGTSRDRVCVHCLHQHDAPGCDFLADELLAPHGLSGRLFDPAFAKKAIARVANAVRRAADNLRPVTHVGVGRAVVEHVASNRRVMGPDGKVKYVRYSATKDPKIRAEPEGLIDPYVRLLGFWDGETPVVTMTYYATHPQSYYGGGGVSADFPGLARGLRDKDQPKVFHVHFNGAGGNITAGKYNDGSPQNRPLLAQRLAEGMKAAFDHVKKFPVEAADVSWRVVPVALPVRDMYQDQKALEGRMADDKLPELDRLRAARNLAFARYGASGAKVDLACLKVGPAHVVHMPGELFIEYQLAAQKLRPDAPVLMAAYGDYGAGYIGTSIAYTQGGYETGPVSRVAPEVEGVLMQGLRELLK